MLIKQLFRDLRHDWLQFLAVFLMSFLCLLVYSSLNSISAGMAKHATAFFQQTALSDIIISATDLNASDINRISTITDVTKVEPRLVLNAQLNSVKKGPFNLTLVATDAITLSQPLVADGLAYDGKTEGLWLNKELADNQALNLNDTVSLELNDQTVDVAIVGIIQHPEFLYFAESLDQPYPNYHESGYGFLAKSYLEDLFSITNLPDNQLSIATNKTDNITWFQEESQQILGSRYQKSTLTMSQTAITEFLDKQQQVEKLALLFPLLFIVLSSLTMASTMKRFIQKQQLTIGTYLALGFAPWTIYRYYLSFGIMISGSGALLGIAIGPSQIAPLLTTVLKEQYNLPNWKPEMTFSVAIVALFLVSCSMLMTYFPCRKILQQPAANALRLGNSAKTKPGKIENARLLNLLSFTNHWVARSILRNKGRSFMGIFGAFGCTVLLVAGIGIYYSIQNTVDQTFDETNGYEEKIAFDRSPSAEEQHDLSTQLKHQTIQWFEQRVVETLTPQGVAEQTVSIIADTPLLKLVDSRQQLIKIERLTNNEVILTEKAAHLLNASVGDTIYVKRASDLQFQSYIVAGIAVISAPQGIIMNQKVWEQRGYDFQPTSLLLAAPLPKPLRTSVTDLAFVASTTLKKVDYYEIKNLLKSTIIIVILIVLVAIFLGIVILVNFNLLIFSERFREFATLKVLGFTQKEMRALSFRENIFLTITGLSLGFIGGHYFLNAYVAIISPSNQQFFAFFAWQQYLLVSLLVIGCSLCINLGLDHNIRKISMSESLKSNE